MATTISEEHARLLRQQHALVAQLKDILANQRLAGAQEALSDGPSVDWMRNDSDNEAEQDLLDVEVAKRLSLGDAAEVPAPPEEFQHSTWEAPDPAIVSVKPWLSAMLPPTDWSWERSEKAEAAPPGALVMEHVYGYHGHGLRHNVAYVDEHRILYHTAAVCIVLDLGTNRQSFYRGHTGEVLCVAYNAATRRAASGDMGPRPRLCVWHVDNPGSESEVVFTNHRRGIISVALTPDGNRLLSVGIDYDHAIFVHDLTSRSVILHVNGGPDRMYGGYWLPAGPKSESDSPGKFVTIGLKRLDVWNGGSALPVQLGQDGRSQSFLSCCVVDSRLFVGCESGEVYAIQDGRVREVLTAHSSACFAVAYNEQKQQLVTGGRDGFVNFWSLNGFARCLTVDLNRHSRHANLNSVRAIHTLGGKILVGTLTSAIYELRHDAGNVEVSQVVEGHCGDLSRHNHQGDILGIASHPDGTSFATTGDDRSLRVWNLTERRCRHFANLTGQGTSLAYNPSGTYLAVGLKSGLLCVHDARRDYAETWRWRLAKKRVQCVRFSPCGRFLAAGTARNVVHVFSVGTEGEITPCHTTQPTSSVVVSIDFSVDSKVLLASCQAYDIAFYSTETGQQLKPEEAKDVEWSTFTSALGWNVQGIWPGEPDGTSVSAVGLSAARKLLASGEDRGRVRLFQYPCVGSGLDRNGALRRRPAALEGNGHGSTVTGITFAGHDQYLISVGSDQSIIQWRYEPGAES